MEDVKKESRKVRVMRGEDGGREVIKEQEKD